MIDDNPSLIVVGGQDTLITLEDDGERIVVPYEQIQVIEIGAQGAPGAQGIQGIPGPSGAGVMEVAFAFGDSTPKNLVVATAGKQVYNVGIHIHTAFNGAGAALAIGDSGDPSRLMSSAMNDPTALGSYGAAPNHRYATNTQLILTITPGGGASQGGGIVTLQIEQ